MNTTSNADAGNNVLWPGATPTFGARITPKSLRASGVAPGHSVCALHTNFPAILRPQCRRFLPEQIDGAHMHDPESNRGERPMPLVKLPEPMIASSVFFRFQVNENGTAKNPSRAGPLARLPPVALD
jgi:hypothetical protein